VFDAASTSHEMILAAITGASHVGPVA
jgi:hypothetical protein